MIKNGNQKRMKPPTTTARVLAVFCSLRKRIRSRRWTSFEEWLAVPPEPWWNDESKLGLLTMVVLWCSVIRKLECDATVSGIRLLVSFEETLSSSSSSLVNDWFGVSWYLFLCFFSYQLFNGVQQQRQQHEHFERRFRKGWLWGEDSFTRRAEATDWLDLIGEFTSGILYCCLKFSMRIDDGVNCVGLFRWLSRDCSGAPACSLRLE